MKKFLSSLLLVASVVVSTPVANAVTWSSDQSAMSNRLSQWYYHGACKGMTPAQATSCAGNNRWTYHIGP
jgi:hypothetical protein